MGLTLLNDRYSGHPALGSDLFGLQGAALIGGAR